MDQETFLIFVLAALAAIAVAGIGWVLTGLKKSPVDKRMAQMSTGNARTKRTARDVENDGSNRRKQVEDTLSELERRQKEEKAKLTLRLRLDRAGLELEEKTFYILSAVLGFVCIGISMLFGMPPAAALLGGFAAGFGMPRWIVTFLTNRRQKAFTAEFANAVDVIVRGIKSGLPVNDCLRIVSTESSEPVKGEFTELVESLKLGISMDQSLARILERMPLAEVNFFMIVMVIQQQTGGNLSEALGNLSTVLRDRKKMRGKIQAMSQEAKSSAAIIGALPPGVMGMITLTSPDYMNLLYTTTTGNLIIMGGLTWMLIGVLVMRKMINFQF
ncbi:MAG: type II secretion system F family protein [Parvibaculaceae bacterium]|nr:type II secretion system F family protein [Parvibaculaceae bacterium]